MKELLKKITKHYKEGLELCSANVEPIHLFNQAKADQSSTKKSA